MRSKRCSSGRGIALIAVLWGLVLLAVIAASFATTSRTEIRLARNAMENARARALADAGVHRAVLGLAETDPERRLAADGTLYRFVFVDGQALIRIEDEGGKIDLNRAPDQMLKGLFLAAGLDADASAAMVDAIVDFRDANDARRLNGAEDDDYRAAGRRYGAKDRPFEAVEELRQVLGMTPELYALVAPALTVHSRQRKVNRDTASPLVLVALAAGSGAAAAEAEAEAPPEEEAEGEGEAPAEEGGEAVDIGAGEEAEPAEGEAPTAARSSRRRRAVTIRAEGHTATGAVFVREAVVRFTPRLTSPVHVRSWRQGGLAPAPTPESEAAE